ncbi:hypothetical protein C8Q77DRAFT_1092081 [Trametes polyzona]|nr:hypothetical protein C8Q77DRAFT_1092081 [Trametes polyzona]
MAHPKAPLSPASTNKRKRPPESEDGPGKKTAKNVKPILRVSTDIDITPFNTPSLEELLSAGDSDTDSLFDEAPPQISSPGIEDMNTSFAPSLVDEVPLDLIGMLTIPASRTAPSIPGLYFDPFILLPEALGDELMWTCIRTFFRDGTSNQVMLFDRAPEPGSSYPSRLPACLTNLLSSLEDLLRPAVPPDTHELLFSPSPKSHNGPPRARQAIINLYWPGEGISPHVDLLDRYGDGIIGVSLGSGCVMRFSRAENAAGDASQETSGGCGLYLPKGSVLVMTEEARYQWTHGIEKRFEDLVEDASDASRSVSLERDVRLSITFRWLLPGADVVGPTSCSDGTQRP